MKIIFLAFKVYQLKSSLMNRVKLFGANITSLAVSCLRLAKSAFFIMKTHNCLNMNSLLMVNVLMLVINLIKMLNWLGEPYPMVKN